jgi:hypothetical protein
VLEEITVPHVTGIDCVVPDTIVTPLIFVRVSVPLFGAVSFHMRLIGSGVFIVVVYISSRAIGFATRGITVASLFNAVFGSSEKVGRISSAVDW